MLKQLLEQAASNNGKARLYAFENTVELTNLIPPTVSYESGGNTLIVGPTAIGESAAFISNEQPDTFYRRRRRNQNCTLQTQFKFLVS